MISIAISSAITSSSSSRAVRRYAGTVPVPGATTVALDLAARNIAFDKGTLSAPAGATVALAFVNDDPGVPHNFALYTDATAATPVFVGEVITGRASTPYTFTAPGTPGTYFFRRDPHPATMTGSFVVTEGPAPAPFRSSGTHLQVVGRVWTSRPRPAGDGETETIMMEQSGTGTSAGEPPRQHSRKRHSSSPVSSTRRASGSGGHGPTLSA